MRTLITLIMIIALSMQTLYAQAYVDGECGSCPQGRYYATQYREAFQRMASTSGWEKSTIKIREGQQQTRDLCMAAAAYQRHVESCSACAPIRRAVVEECSEVVRLCTKNQEDVAESITVVAIIGAVIWAVGQLLSE